MAGNAGLWKLTQEYIRNQSNVTVETFKQETKTFTNCNMLSDYFTCETYPIFNKQLIRVSHFIIENRKRSNNYQIIFMRLALLWYKKLESTLGRQPYLNLTHECRNITSKQTITKEFSNALEMYYIMTKSGLYQECNAAIY